MASVGQLRTPVRIRATVGLAATATAVVVAGCATVPSGGAPQLVQPGGNQVQAYVEQLPPPPPQAYHNPDQVVLAFLHAGASYAFDPAAVSQYLVPKLRATWHPGRVTIFSSFTYAQPPRAPVHSQQEASSEAGQTASVEFHGQQLATLIQTGQYTYSPGTNTYPFTLQKENGVWLISALPPGKDSLLLTQDAFVGEYQARNLFFFAGPPPSDSILVPDPVYAAGALNTNLASKLVEGLLSDQGSSLSGATWTAFPRGTRLLGNVAISGQTAIVDLGGTAVDTSTNQQQQDMVDQLQTTLAYSPSLARFVQLEINGHVANTVQVPDLIDDVPRGPLVYQSGPNSISQGLESQPPSLGQPEFGSTPITAIAMNPAAAPQAVQVAVATQDGNGCQLYVQPAPVAGQSTAQPYDHVRISTSGGQCTSLSWDTNGYLWAAAGHKIWALKTPNGRRQAVALPTRLTSSGHGPPQIIALRMAPDGVRAALLIKSGAHNRLVLAAVSNNGSQLSLGEAVPTGTGLRDPQAMSWFSPYDLMVLDESGIGKSAIAEVPLASGAAERLGSAPAGATSLTTNGVTIAVGTVDHAGDHEILTSPPTRTTWTKRATGAIPIYPG